MIQRSAVRKLEEALSRQPAVGLIGPRQVGKTTLALALAETRPSLYLDCYPLAHWCRRGLKTKGRAEDAEGSGAQSGSDRHAVERHLKK